tara:strand:+ start:1111 stop:2346 length:1236 start_codon:yes stop_codon:yes gene_type:complete
VDFLIARQPIFDISGDVVAYELLFRTHLENVFPEFDGDRATANVMMDNFILNNVTTLTDGKKAYINFTEKLLLEEFAFYLPKNDVVIEILETIPAHDAAIIACKKLCDAGYTIALDDFVLEPGNANAALIDHCHTIKVDYLATTVADRQKIIAQLKDREVTLLAEKIETLADYELARSEGFSYFQGYFFAKPEIVTGTRLPENKLSKMLLVKAVNAADFDVENIVLAIKRDVSLSYKLLRCINSAAFGFSKKITSIKHAVVYLGLQEMRKWVSFVAMADMCDEKSPELLRTALTRAHLGEQLASYTGMRGVKDDIFLTGLFSLADAMMGRPMAEIIEEIPLADTVKETLLGDSAGYRPILDFVEAFEKGDWTNLDVHCRKLNITQDQLLTSCNNTTAWVQEALVTVKLAGR